MDQVVIVVFVRRSVNRPPEAVERAFVDMKRQRGDLAGDQIDAAEEGGNLKRGEFGYAYA
jgi:hypothetical protein